MLRSSSTVSKRAASQCSPDMEKSVQNWHRPYLRAQPSLLVTTLHLTRALQTGLFSQVLAHYAAIYSPYFHWNCLSCTLSSSLPNLLSKSVAHPLSSRLQRSTTAPGSPQPNSMFPSSRMAHRPSHEDPLSATAPSPLVSVH